MRRHLRKRLLYNIKFGHLFIKCSIKNTIFTLTDKNFKVLYQISTKSSKIKDFRKNTPYIIQNVSIVLAKKIRNTFNLKHIICHLNGIGIGRYNFLYYLTKYKIKIIAINEKTSLPFNGCRPKKRKRR